MSGRSRERQRAVFMSANGQPPGRRRGVSPGRRQLQLAAPRTEQALPGRHLHDKGQLPSGMATTPLTTRVRYVRDIYERGGAREVLGMLRTRVVRRQPLTLDQILRPEVAVALDISACLSELAADLGITPPTPKETECWLDEWRSLVASSDYAAHSHYPGTWDVEVRTSQVLYAITRWRRPRVALETGVARGASSLSILTAMSINGLGQLYSFDVGRDVGSLVPEELRSSWNLMVLDSTDLRASFVDSLGTLPKVDLFFHDSDRSYRWMMFEYSHVIPRMNHEAIFASDDVQHHTAFFDAPLVTASRVFLLDGRKAAGFAAITGADSADSHRGKTGMVAGGVQN